MPASILNLSAASVLVPVAISLRPREVLDNKINNNTKIKIAITIGYTGKLLSPNPLIQDAEGNKSVPPVEAIPSLFHGPITK